MDKRGRDNESVVRRALELLMEDPKHDLKKMRRRITGIVHTAESGDPMIRLLDHQGIDFRVHLDNGVGVDIQVKSSQSGKRKHMRLCRKFGRYIAVVVVLFNEKFETIIRKVAGCIANAFFALRRPEAWLFSHSGSTRRRARRDITGYHCPQPAFY